mmetsp:Transcript_44609/g.142960  ORF Transcript_44609/g.142960 Transcript_44609/m.142960 type:complete len:242 (+) Transcript_44609:65-790(+)
MLDDINDNVLIFLQCVIFIALKARGAYPVDTFIRQRLFGHLCVWSGSPEVESYVTGLCETLRVVLCRGHLRRVRVRFLAEHGWPAAASEVVVLDVLAEEADLRALEGLGRDVLGRRFALALQRLEVALAALCGAASAEAEASAGGPSEVWSVEAEMRDPAWSEVGGGSSAAAQDELGARWLAPQPPSGRASRRRAAATAAGAAAATIVLVHPLAVVDGIGGIAALALHLERHTSVSTGPAG